MLPRLAKGVLILGDALRRRREERRLSRTELADLSGLTTKTIQRAEADGPVSPAVVRELCRVLGLELAEVMRPSHAEVAMRLLACGRAPAAAPDEWVDREPETLAVLAHLGCSAETDVPSTRAPRPPGAHLCAIAGPPGIGKTALAQHVVARLAPCFPDGIAWLDASRLDNPTRVATAQRDIAHALGFGAALPGIDSAARDLAQAFRQHFASRRRLLVIDDVRDPERLDPFFGPGASDLLFTTHSRRVAERAGAAIVELGPIASEVARAVLEHHLGLGRLDPAPVARGVPSLLALIASAPGTINLTGRLLAREPFTRPFDLVRRGEQAGLGELSEAGAHALGGWWEERLFRSFDALRPALSHTAWHLWTTLSVLGSCPFSSAQAAGLCELSSEATCRGLSELLDHYLLTCPDIGAPSAESLLCFDPHSAAAARAVLGPARDAILDRLVGLVLAANDPGLSGWVDALPELAARCRAKLSARTPPEAHA